MIKQKFVINAAAERKKKSKSKRVLLINPPYCRPLRYLQYHFNQGLGYIASIIEQMDLDVAIYNADLELDLQPQQSFLYGFEVNYDYIKEFLNDDFTDPFWDEVREIVNAYDPWVIGFSVMTNKYNISNQIAKFIKSFRPDVKIIYGGHHPTLFPLDVLKNSFVDFVITGEGEKPIKNLMDYLIDEKNDLKNINNIYYKKDGKIFGSQKKEREIELDRLPLPLRESLLGYQEMPSNWFSGVITSRGCPFSCTYCGSKNVFGKKIIYRQPKLVIDEMKEMNQKYGVNVFNFVDDTFNVNKNFAIKIANGVGELSDKIKWSCNLRLDLIDSEQLDAFKNNGCVSIWLGIESGSDRILKNIKKGFDKKLIREKVKIIKDSGINWGGYFMIGFPDETRDEMLKTLEFMKELEPTYAQINIYNPLPGTELYNQICNKNNFFNTEINWSLQSQTSLGNLRLLVDEEGDIEEFVLNIIGRFDEYNLRNK